MKKLIAMSALGFSLLIASPAFAYGYEVKSGDTMYEIAKNHGMTLNELSRLNPQVHNINMIYAGDVLNTARGAMMQKASSYNAPTSNVSGSSRDLLARLVRAEAQDESFTGKVAVAEVVLNRVASDNFPNTIQSVIYQSGQFSPVNNGSINVPADADCYRAVDQALRGSNTVGNSLYFYNPRTATSRWLDSKPTVAVIGNHTFK